MFYLGVLGATLILIAFLLDQVRIWRNTYFIYDFINFVGALFLLLYALDGQVWPFVVLNAVWSIVSLKDCLTDLRRNAKRTGESWWNKWMH